jgi:hypothetical protein
MKDIINIERDSTKEFWYSHIIILIGTVAAVYLAAQAGLSTAITYEEIQSNQNAYYMQSSMLDELKDNIKYTNTISSEFLDDKRGKYLGHKGEYQIDTYIWQTMKFSPDTFEIPSSTLTSVRRYYQHADVAIGKMTARSATRWTNDSATAILAEGKKLEKELFPAIEKDLQILKEKLLKYDIKV